VQFYGIWLIRRQAWPTRLKVNSDQASLSSLASMDQDFCLICNRHTLGGIYCSQQCRMQDLEQALPQQSPHNHTQAPHVDYFSTGSAASTPSSSPSVLPTTKSNAPSLPVLSSSVDRFFLSRPAPSEGQSARSSSFVTSENTSVWRNRNLLYYGV
jgi:hypothetical protein